MVTTRDFQETILLNSWSTHSHASDRSSCSSKDSTQAQKNSTSSLISASIWKPLRKYTTEMVNSHTMIKKLSNPVLGINLSIRIAKGQTRPQKPQKRMQKKINLPVPYMALGTILICERSFRYRPSL